MTITKPLTTTLSPELVSAILECVQTAPVPRSKTDPIVHHLLAEVKKNGGNLTK